MPYSLPKLAYAYGALAPHISEEQLRLHHEKHHQAYVDGANAIIQKLEDARKAGADVDMKSMLKSLSFNIAGHVMHSLFWENLTPDGGGEPEGKLGEAIAKDFGSFARFKTEFTQAALSVEGSGWAALSYCQALGRLVIQQVEKHNVNVVPSMPVLMVLDVFEHAYYIDYRNARARFIDAFWNVVNWDAVEKRLAASVNS
jgi:Fe-Mn family superoxide dismutase